MDSKISAQQIIDYYDNCDIDYQLIWDLDNSYAMHYGYWDEKVKNLAQSLEWENEILAERAKIKSSDMVLDAGCGVGGSSIFLAKRFGCQVTGITLCEKQARQAKSNTQKSGVAGNIEFLVMGFENILFPDKIFDVVWMIESVCHVSDKKKFIENAFRILKPNGRLIIADGFANYEYYNKIDEKIMRKWLSGWSVNFLETAENFEKFLAQAGFIKISFLDITKYVMLSAKRLYKYSFPAIFYGKIAEFLKIRNKTQTGNIIAARYQYKSLLKKLWQYGIFYAEKYGKN